MLILKTIYRFFAIDYIIKIIKNNIFNIISSVLWTIGFQLLFVIVGAVTLKLFPGINIPFSETINQLIIETPHNKLIILILLGIIGIISIFGICSITLLAFYLTVLLIVTPITLITRFNDIFKKVKAENENH